MIEILTHRAKITSTTEKRTTTVMPLKLVTQRERETDRERERGREGVVGRGTGRMHACSHFEYAMLYIEACLELKIDARAFYVKTMGLISIQTV